MLVSWTAVPGFGFAAITYYKYYLLAWDGLAEFDGPDEAERFLFFISRSASL